jgi:glucose/arabinose dehydrogenase/cytochrome c2
MNENGSHLQWKPITNRCPGGPGRAGTIPRLFLGSFDMTKRLASALIFITFSSLAFAGDPNAGKQTFRQQCALCHSAEPNDNGGAQGPNLTQVYGRRAATAASFSYSKPLIDSGLIWDAATLDRFLASPTAVVPGSAMVVAVPDKSDREHLIAYFKALKDGSFKEAPAASRSVSRQAVAAFLAGFGCHAPVEKAQTLLVTIQDTNALLEALGCKVPQAQKGDADWKRDTPGRVHRIEVQDLPAPFATPAVAIRPTVVDKPSNAKLSVPEGFRVDIFASGVQGPRTLRVAPNGDIFVAQPREGRVSVLRPAADGSKADTVTTFAQGLVEPYGIQFHPRGSEPQWVYISENNRVVRYRYRAGDTQASGVPEVVIERLTQNGSGGHSTRDLAFSADGRRLFVSVGSQSNVAEDMPKKTPAEAKAWEAQHGLGAAWGTETNRAAVLVFEVSSNRPGRIFASGIRNCVGLTVHPKSGDLWCTTNERDMLGDDLVPDYSTRVKENAFYGWPWYYLGSHEDPRLKGDRPDLAGKALMPDVLYRAHSAALSLVLYPTAQGRSAFPAQYQGDGFAVLHGSWNRGTRTGHKVVRVRMKNGEPTGEYEDFLVGFIIDDARVWGRPAAAEVASDGSLLISDDGAQVIHRISYAQQ